MEDINNNLQTISGDNKPEKLSGDRIIEVKPLNEDTYEDEIDLADLFMYLRSKLIFLCIALIAGAAIGLSVTKFLITPIYQASSYLYMLSSSSKSVIDINAFNIGTSVADDYKQLLIRLPVLENVANEIDDITIIDGADALEKTQEQKTFLYKIKKKLSGFTNEDPNIINGKMYLLDAGDLEKYISTSIVDNSRIMKITITTTDPMLSKKIANQLAEQAVSYIPEITVAPAPTIAQKAVTPKNRYKPSYSKNTLIGGFLGLLFVGLIFVVKYLRDDSIKDAEDMERIFGITPITVIPEGRIKDSSKAYRKKGNKKENKKRESKK